MLQRQPKAAQRTTTDHVFDTLYRAVVQLELPPGTRVSEAEIAERLQVSRQPVRDAFFRLANRGFIEIQPQRATLVTRISQAEVLQAAFVRIALETACLSEAVTRATGADIAALRGILDAQSEAVDSTDHGRFHELDEAFHATLCEIAGQPKVWHLIQEQKGHMDRVRFLSLSFNQPATLDEHLGIVAALEARDEPTARARLDAHLNKIRIHLEPIRQAHAAYFEGGT